MSLQEQGRGVLYLAHCCKLLEQAAWKAAQVNEWQMLNYMGYRPATAVLKLKRPPPKPRPEPSAAPQREPTREQRLKGWLTTAGYELPMLRGALEAYSTGEKYGYSLEKCRQLRKDIAEWEQNVAAWKAELAGIEDNQEAQVA